MRIATIHGHEVCDQLDIETNPPSTSLLEQSLGGNAQSASHQAKEHASLYASCLHRPHAQLRRCGSAAQLSTAAIVLSIIIPLLALIIWIARRQVDGYEFNTIFATFSGERIGGRFSKSQAKAIDVVTGAVLAPLVAAGFNVVLFSSARATVVDEKMQKAIPLRSLLVASTTSSGSYDFIRYAQCASLRYVC